ncbi:MAG: hypothetical protein C0404_13535 [Verrucomicrobia bacterium]|nr:hypothetical protein [Verrucomicrobiota bacterium]
MLAYYDTGTLVPFYVDEVFSDAVRTIVENRHEVIALNVFQQLEVENALRLKVFRGEMEDNSCQSVLRKIEANVKEGRIVLRPVDWINAMQAARHIGAKMTAKAGCRTLDLLHVAIAVQWKSAIFVTADDRQSKAATAAGLQVVDVRTLPREHSSAGYGVPTGRVRERRTHYGTKRK